MNVSHSTALAAPVANFGQYVQLVESFPRLDENEERDLAERLHRDNDLDAAKQLITSHLRYVVYIARGYMGYGLPQDDLLQEGNIGLMKAVRRFDPSHGVRLAAYASYWIRAHIHDFILKNWRIVKVVSTKAKRKLFYKLRGAKQRLEWLNRAEADEIASAMQVSTADVVDMESQLYQSDESFDLAADAANGEWQAPANFVQSPVAAPETIVAENDFMSTAATALREALPLLDDRSRDIIESRWLADDDKETLQSLGHRYGISAERVRQIENAAIGKLRAALADHLGVDCNQLTNTALSA